MAPHYPHSEIHQWTRQAVETNDPGLLDARIGHHDVEATIEACHACSATVSAWREGEWGSRQSDLVTNLKW
jgi:hypothetical protein